MLLHVETKTRPWETNKLTEHSTSWELKKQKIARYE